MNHRSLPSEGSSPERPIEAGRGSAQSESEGELCGSSHQCRKRQSRQSRPRSGRPSRRPGHGHRAHPRRIGLRDPRQSVDRTLPATGDGDGPPPPCRGHIGAKYGVLSMTMRVPTSTCSDEALVQKGGICRPTISLPKGHATLRSTSRTLRAEPDNVTSLKHDGCSLP